MKQEPKQAQAHETALQVILPSAFSKCSPTWMIGATVLRSSVALSSHLCTNLAERAAGD